MLYEELLRYKATNGIIAYYKWADGEGLLVGRVIAVSITEARFVSIDTLGREEEEETVPLESIFRIEDTPEYIERLRLFALHAQNVPEEVRGSSAKSQRVIAKYLREAQATGECVEVTLVAGFRKDCRILEVDSTHCAFEQYDDNPLGICSRMVVKLTQIVKLTRRSSNAQAVSAVWKARGVSPASGE